MGKLLSFFGGWQGYVIAAAIAACLASAGTWRVMSWREQAHEAQAAKETVRLAVHQAEIGTNLGAIYVPQFVFIQTETTRRVAEITKHVTPEIDGAYLVPFGFVRVWNDATHGPIPPATAGRDQDPSGVPLSDVARAHTEDQGTLDLCRKQVALWWDWYDQNKAAWPK